MKELDPDPLLIAYRSLPGELSLPKLSQMRLVVDRSVIGEGDDAAVASLIAANQSGWIAFRSGVDWFSPGRELPSSAVGLGPALSAELVTAAASVRLWFDGAAGGGWRLATVREVEVGGEAYLAQDITLLSDIWSEVGGGNLRYRRYWGLAEDGTTRPRHARFLGFEREEG